MMITLRRLGPTRAASRAAKRIAGSANCTSTSRISTCPQRPPRQPAIALPLGASSGGLPIGVQLAGRFGEEGTLLQVAAQLEEAMPWRERRPGVHVGSSGSGG